MLPFHARIPDLLRTHVWRRRTGVDAPDVARVFSALGVTEIARTVCELLRLDTAQRRVEETASAGDCWSGSKPTGSCNFPSCVNGAGEVRGG